MKKQISLLLAILLLAGLGSGAFAAETADDAAREAIIEDMIAANTWEEIISRHDNMLIRTEYEDGWLSTSFLTKDYACDLTSGNLYDREDNWRYVEVNGETSFALDWYAMSEEERDGMIWKPEDLFPVLYEDVLRQDEVGDLTANEDGTLTLTLTLGAEKFASIQASLGNPLPEEYAGVEYMAAFVLDAETFEILISEEDTIFEGEKTLLIRTEIEYDAEQPEEVAEMLSLAEEYRASEPEDPRTVTVTYSAGSDEEESYSVVTDRKYRVVPFTREGYELYSDPEGTELFEGSDEVGDTILYAFPAA